MAQQSLYRRYRPRRFGEIKGQEHVVRALQNAVASESEGHAYLFSGPRGTGKTSTARILAKALNCTNLTEGEPCCECDSCVSIEQGKSFDLFELDAASNNGVDAVRDLVERSAVSSPGRTKVYILDEVHMLTAAASNALLKTLEEPPDHVRFVLATTDPQKVLPTIRSRTQHFEFFLLSADELSEHVRWVAKDAGLDVDDEAVAYAVRQGRGSVRDTLSALDQVVAAGGVLVRAEPVDQLFEAMAGTDPGVAIVAVADAIAQGHDPRVLGEAFLSAVRDSFLVSLGVDTPHLVDADRERTSRWAGEIGTPGLTRAMERVGQALVDMRTAADPRVPLEVALVQLTLPSGEADAAQAPAATTPESGDEPSSGGADLDSILTRLDRIEAKLRAENQGGGSSRDASTEKRPRAEAAPSMPRAAEPANAVSGEAQPDADAKPQPRAAEPAKPREADRPKRSAARAAPPPPPPRRRGGGADSGSTSAGSKTAATKRSEQESVPQDDAPQPAPTTDAKSAPAASEPDPAPQDSNAAAGGVPDRDAIVMAFGDAVVPKLKGVAKAIYSGGRFLVVAGGTAVFALDNAPTVDRAEKYRQAVEELLAEKLGSVVPIRLVTEADADSYGSDAATTSTPAADARKARGDDQNPASSEATDLRSQDAPAAPTRPGPPGGDVRRSAPQAESKQAADPAPVAEEPNPTAASDEEAELAARVDELEIADVSTRGVDKLTDAFPGAELIETEEKQ